jgi:alcohol dehydrogenase
MAMESVRELAKQVGIPSLTETAFNPIKVDKLANQAMRTYAPGNPKDVTIKDLKAIYLKAYQG